MFEIAERQAISEEYLWQMVKWTHKEHVGYLLGKKVGKALTSGNG
jgi:hypothetical protein